MNSDLLAAARRIRVIAFLGALAWLFGIDPPAGQRVLLIVLAAAAVAADLFLDEHKTRTRHPNYDRAA